MFAAGSFGRYVQRKLADEDLWQGNFSTVREALRMGVAICERWSTVCETLTMQFWKRFAPHPWKGEKFVPDSLKKLSERLEEVVCYFTISVLCVCFSLGVCLVNSDTEVCLLCCCF